MQPKKKYLSFGGGLNHPFSRGTIVRRPLSRLTSMPTYFRAAARDVERPGQGACV
jgi:hypothetical protein